MNTLHRHDRPEWWRVTLLYRNASDWSYVLMTPEDYASAVAYTGTTPRQAMLTRYEVAETIKHEAMRGRDVSRLASYFGTEEEQ
jgi:hypothetical protein